MLTKVSIHSEQRQENARKVRLLGKRTPIFGPFDGETDASDFARTLRRMDPDFRQDDV